METITKTSSVKTTSRTMTGKPQARLDFARRLRELRVPRGFRTARSLAKALGIDENRYTRYERAEVEPDLALIRRICLVLCTTPTELLGLGEPDEALEEPVAATFSGPVSLPSDTDVRDAPSKGSREINIDFAAWKLACAVAEARLAEQDVTGTRGIGAPSSMALLTTASPLYRRLRQAPFETIAELAADRGIADAPPALSSRILASIDSLVAAVREGADTARPR